jgi:hypothetical protein
MAKSEALAKVDYADCTDFVCALPLTYGGITERQTLAKICGICEICVLFLF